MYGRRPSRFSRGMERKIYYPSRRAVSAPARREPPEPSRKAQPQRHSRFRRHDTEIAGSTPAAGKRFRPHSDTPRDAKKKEKRFRAHSSEQRSGPGKPVQKTVTAPTPVQPITPQYSSEPVYAYYPVMPVYAPPPPPPYPYGFYDPYDIQMSDEELDELNAMEDYEDRYGRDFYHFRRSRADETVAKKERPEVLPKNYLADDNKSN